MQENITKKNRFCIKEKKKGQPILWKDIAKIRKLTKKPIILKGILSKNDAKT